MQILDIKPENLIETIAPLKNEFDMLVSISGVDNQENFEVVYHLLSTSSNKKICIKSTLGKNNPKIESLTSLFSAADWHEREAYDLFGIEFANHPDLKRILLPLDWIGHPGRKDYVNNDERLSWNER